MSKVKVEDEDFDGSDRDSLASGRISRLDKRQAENDTSSEDETSIKSTTSLNSREVFISNGEDHDKKHTCTLVSFEGKNKTGTELSMLHSLRNVDSQTKIVSPMSNRNKESVTNDLPNHKTHFDEQSIKSNVTSELSKPNKQGTTEFHHRKQTFNQHDQERASKFIQNSHVNQIDRSTSKHKKETKEMPDCKCEDRSRRDKNCEEKLYGSQYQISSRNTNYCDDVTAERSDSLVNIQRTHSSNSLEVIQGNGVYSAQSNTSQQTRRLSNDSRTPILKGNQPHLRLEDMIQSEPVDGRKAKEPLEMPTTSSVLEDSSCTNDSRNKTVFKRPLIRTRRRKRIYGSDMFPSDSDMRREGNMTRTQSDITAKRLVQKTNSQRRLADIVSSEVFRVRRRMSMPLECLSSIERDRDNESKDVTNDNNGMDSVTSNRNILGQDNTNCQNNLTSKAAGDSYKCNENQENEYVKESETTERKAKETKEMKHANQSVYDIYVELKKMRETVADCVGSKVRNDIEKKLNVLQQKATDADDSGWAKLKHKISILKSNLKQQEEKDKEKEQIRSFVQETIDSIISKVISEEASHPRSAVSVTTEQTPKTIQDDETKCNTPMKDVDDQGTKETNCNTIVKGVDDSEEDEDETNGKIVMKGDDYQNDDELNCNTIAKDIDEQNNLLQKIKITENEVQTLEENLVQNNDGEKDVQKKKTENNDNDEESSIDENINSEDKVVGIKNDDKQNDSSVDENDSSEDENDSSEEENDVESNENKEICDKSNDEYDNDDNDHVYDKTLKNSASANDHLDEVSTRSSERASTDDNSDKVSPRSSKSASTDDNLNEVSPRSSESASAVENLNELPSRSSESAFADDNLCDVSVRSSESVSADENLNEVPSRLSEDASTDDKLDEVQPRSSSESRLSYGHARNKSREDKVTFSLGEQDNEVNTSVMETDRSTTISRAMSAASWRSETPFNDGSINYKDDGEMSALDRQSIWSDEFETEDTFISELESPAQKLDLHLNKNDLNDDVVSCIIQTHDGISETLESSFVDPLELPSATDTYEIVLSYFVKLASPDIGQITSEEIVTVAIPYDREELIYYQEPELRVLCDGQWKEVDFVDKVYQDEDNMSIAVLETNSPELTVWVVVAKPIIDHVHFNAKKNEAISTNDSDVFMSVSPGSRYNPLNMKIEFKVIPILPEVLEEAKITANDDMTLLFNVSSFVTIELEEDPSQPISIYLPCNKPYVRPQTGSRSSSRRSGRKSAKRLGTADSGYRTHSSSSGYNEIREETENHLVRMGTGMPLKHKVIKPKDIDKYGKILCTVLEKACTCVVIEGRKFSKTPDIEKVVSSIANVLEFRKVHVCMMQSKSNLRHVKIACTLQSQVNLLEMQKLGKGHNISEGTFRLREGDVIRLSFRGNIAPIKDVDKFWRFYGIHGFNTDWVIAIVDMYSQRSLEYFCGFLQVFKWKDKCSFDIHKSCVKDSRKWELVGEVQVTLPKTAPRAIPYSSRTPVRLKGEGPITVEYLVSLANRIGNEWPQVARALRIEHARLQSIIQQNRNNMVAKLVVDILLTWLKRSPHSKDKAMVLSYALRNCGRKDLSDEIREKDRIYKMERSCSARESRMNLAILTVSRCPSASTKWRPLAHGLGLDDIDVKGIEHVYGGETVRCEQMLNLWKHKETEYRLKTLVNSLRNIGCQYTADYVQSARKF